jgi:hypothetical protein
MNAKNPHQTMDSPAPGATEPVLRDGRASSWLNWGLAICTVPGAAIVMLFALGAVMSTAACTARTCPNLGRGGIDFGVAFYGAPVVAFVVIVLSFFTAKRRTGIVVPLLGWGLLIADVAVMALAVAP